MRAILLALALSAPACATPEPRARPAAAQIHPTEAEQLLIEQRMELARQARMELARRAARDKDILLWGKALFPEKFSLPFCKELHGYLVSIRGAAFASTEAPRGHAKTTIECFLIPIFQALEEPQSFRHYLNVQATAEKAVDITRAIKLELEQNRELRELYGDQVDVEKWTEKQFVLRNGVVFSAVGAMQSIRGINYRSLRPDYITIDDLYDEDEISSLDATRKRNKWFWGSLYKARAIGRRTSIHLLGTPANDADLLKELQADKDVVSRTFRAIKDWQSKEVLWHEANTYDSLMRDMRGMGTVIFMREMQCERRDSAESIVKADWLEGWEYDPDQLRFKDQDLKLMAVVLGVDPSIGEKETNDPTAAVLVYEGRPDGVTGEDGHQFYIEGAWNERLTWDGRMALLRSIKERQADRGHRVTRANIEGIAGFKDFALKARGTGLPVNVVDRVPSKIVHLENKSFYFENRRVRISKRIPKELREEIAYQLTTNRPKNDDLRDALLHALPGRKVQRWRPA